MIARHSSVALLLSVALFPHPAWLLGEEKSPALIRTEGSRDDRADRVFTVQPRDGAVEFTAVGWPGALTIRGAGAPPVGTIVVDGAKVSGVVGLDLATLDTGINLRNRHMKDNYLEISKYPRAELSLTRLALPDAPPAGEFEADNVAFEGELSLHGVRRPVRGSTHIRRKGTALEVAASFEINTNDFGIATPGYMGVTVAEKIKVKVHFSSRLLPTKSAER
jgi:polyisoprenoid-binding protein YceI